MERLTTLIVSLTIISLLYQNIIWAGGLPCSPSAAIPDKSLNSNIIPDLNLPENIATIKERYCSELPQPKTILHVQDSHANYHAQMNIAKILDVLYPYSSNNFLIAVEGAEGMVDVSKIQSFPHKEAKRMATDYLIKEGLMTGAEFFMANINPGKDILIWGVENRDLYKENLMAFREMQRHKDSAKTAIRQIERDLRQLINNTLNEEQRRFISKMMSYQKDEIGLEEYAVFLKEMAVGEETYKNFSNLIKLIELKQYIDFEKVEKERMALIKNISKKYVKEEMIDVVTKGLRYQVGEISACEYYSMLEKYLRDINLIEAGRKRNWKSSDKDTADKYKNLSLYMDYIKINSLINSQSLFKEITQIERQIAEGLFKTLAQNDIYARCINLTMIDKFIELRIYREDLVYFKAHKDQFYQYNSLIPFLDSFQAFCDLGIKRDGVLVENTLKKMEELNSSKAVLITGGFHTEGLKELFKEKGISYAVVSPRITRVPDKKRYTDLLMRETDPFEKVLAFSGTRLALWSEYCKGLFANEPPDFYSFIAKKGVEVTMQALACFLEKGGEWQNLLANRDEDIRIDVEEGVKTEGNKIIVPFIVAKGGREEKVEITVTLIVNKEELETGETKYSITFKTNDAKEVMVSNLEKLYLELDSGGYPAAGLIGKIVDENGEIITEHILGEVKGNYLFLSDSRMPGKRPIAKIRCRRKYIREEVIKDLEELLESIDIPGEFAKVWLAHPNMLFGELMQIINNGFKQSFYMEEMEISKEGEEHEEDIGVELPVLLFDLILSILIGIFVGILVFAYLGGATSLPVFLSRDVTFTIGRFFWILLTIFISVISPWFAHEILGHYVLGKLSAWIYKKKGLPEVVISIESLDTISVASKDDMEFLSDRELKNIDKQVKLYAGLGIRLNLLCAGLALLLHFAIAPNILHYAVLWMIASSNISLAICSFVPYKIYPIPILSYLRERLSMGKEKSDGDILRGILITDYQLKEQIKELLKYDIDKNSLPAFTENEIIRKFPQIPEERTMKCLSELLNNAVITKVLLKCKTIKRKPKTIYGNVLSSELEFLNSIGWLVPLEKGRRKYLCTLHYEKLLKAEKIVEVYDLMENKVRRKIYLSKGFKKLKEGYEDMEVPGTGKIKVSKELYNKIRNKKGKDKYFKILSVFLSAIIMDEGIKDIYQKTGATVTQLQLICDLIYSTKEDIEMLRRELDKNILKNLIDMFLWHREVKYAPPEDYVQHYYTMYYAMMENALEKNPALALLLLADRFYALFTVGDKEEHFRIYDEIVNVWRPLFKKDWKIDISHKLINEMFKQVRPEEYKRTKHERDSLVENIFTEKTRKKFKSIFVKKIKMWPEVKNIKIIFRGKKCVYSTYTKLERKRQKSPEKSVQMGDALHDLGAIRILTKTVEEIRKIEEFLKGNKGLELLKDTLGVKGVSWNEDATTDYIKKPKANNYRSLHLVFTVQTPSGKSFNFEIQLKTHRMHEWAEKGPAAHHDYKRPEDEAGIKDWIVVRLKVGDQEEKSIILRKKASISIKGMISSPDINFKKEDVKKIMLYWAGGEKDGLEVNLDTILKNWDLVKIDITSNSLYLHPIAFGGILFLWGILAEQFCLSWIGLGIVFILSLKEIFKGIGKLWEEFKERKIIVKYKTILTNPDIAQAIRESFDRIGMIAPGENWKVVVGGSENVDDPFILLQYPADGHPVLKLKAEGKEQEFNVILLKGEGNPSRLDTDVIIASKDGNKTLKEFLKLQGVQLDKAALGMYPFTTEPAGYIYQDNTVVRRDYDKILWISLDKVPLGISPASDKNRLHGQGKISPVLAYHVHPTVPYGESTILSPGDIQEIIRRYDLDTPAVIPEVILDKNGNAKLFIPREGIDWELFKEKEYPELAEWYLKNLFKDTYSTNEEYSQLVQTWLQKLSPHFIIVPIEDFMHGEESQQPKESGQSSEGSSVFFSVFSVFISYYYVSRVFFNCLKFLLDNPIYLLIVILAITSSIVYIVCIRPSKQREIKKLLEDAKESQEIVDGTKPLAPFIFPARTKIILFGSIFLFAIVWLIPSESIVVARIIRVLITAVIGISFLFTMRLFIMETVDTWTPPPYKTWGELAGTLATLANILVALIANRHKCPDDSVPRFMFRQVPFKNMLFGNPVDMIDRLLIGKDNREFYMYIWIEYIKELNYCLTCGKGLSLDMGVYEWFSRYCQNIKKGDIYYTLYRAILLSAGKQKFFELIKKIKKSRYIDRRIKRELIKENAVLCLKSSKGLFIRFLLELKKSARERKTDFPFVMPRVEIINTYKQPFEEELEKLKQSIALIVRVLSEIEAQSRGAQTKKGIGEIFKCLWNKLIILSVLAALNISLISCGGNNGGIGTETGGQSSYLSSESDTSTGGTTDEYPDRLPLGGDTKWAKGVGYMKVTFPAEDLRSYYYLVFEDIKKVGGSSSQLNILVQLLTDPDDDLYTDKGLCRTPIPIMQIESTLSIHLNVFAGGVDLSKITGIVIYYEAYPGIDMENKYNDGEPSFAGVYALRVEEIGGVVPFDKIAREIINGFEKSKEDPGNYYPEKELPQEGERGIPLMARLNDSQIVALFGMDMPIKYRIKKIAELYEAGAGEEIPPNTIIALRQYYLKNKPAIQSVVPVIIDVTAIEEMGGKLKTIFDAFKTDGIQCGILPLVIETKKDKNAVDLLKKIGIEGFDNNIISGEITKSAINKKINHFISEHKEVMLDNSYIITTEEHEDMLTKLLGEAAAVFVVGGEKYRIAKYNGSNLRELIEVGRALGITDIINIVRERLIEDGKDEESINMMLKEALEGDPRRNTGEYSEKPEEYRRQKEITTQL